MNFFTNISQLKIQGINLIFFIGASIVAIYMNLKNKNIKLRVVKQMIFYGVLGTVIGAILSNKIENDMVLRKCFGIFLLIIAINGTYTLFLQYIKKKKDKNINVKKYF